MKRLTLVVAVVTMVALVAGPAAAYMGWAPFASWGRNASSSGSSSGYYPASSSSGGYYPASSSSSGYAQVSTSSSSSGYYYPTASSSSGYYWPASSSSSGYYYR